MASQRSSGTNIDEKGEFCFSLILARLDYVPLHTIHYLCRLLTLSLICILFFFQLLQGFLTDYSRAKTQRLIYALHLDLFTFKFCVK